MSAALPLAWALVVVLAAARCQPPAGRVRGLGPPRRDRHRTAPSRPRPRLAAGRDRRRAERRRDAIAAAVPEAADLLGVAVQAGLTVHLAVRAVAPLLPGPLGAELQALARAAAAGTRLADGLDDLVGRGGEAIRGLATALAASERYGVPVGPQLDRLAADLRVAARRRAEEAARRVPVQLLFPLVACILPAFALLTVAPLLVSALRALRL